MYGTEGNLRRNTILYDPMQFSGNAFCSPRRVMLHINVSLELIARLIANINTICLNHHHLQTSCLGIEF
jgi:hypothetical protein